MSELAAARLHARPTRRRGPARRPIARKRRNSHFPVPADFPEVPDDDDEAEIVGGGGDEKEGNA